MRRDIAILHEENLRLIEQKDDLQLHDLVSIVERQIECYLDMQLTPPHKSKISEETPPTHPIVCNLDQRVIIDSNHCKIILDFEIRILEMKLA